MDEKTITKTADVPDEAKAVALNQLLRETETANGIKRTEELLKAFLEADAETAVALQPVMSKILPRFYMKVDMAKARERILAERKKTGYQSQNIDRVACVKAMDGRADQTTKDGKTIRRAYTRKPSKDGTIMTAEEAKLVELKPAAIGTYLFVANRKHEFMKRKDCKHDEYELSFSISDYADELGLSRQQARNVLLESMDHLSWVMVSANRQYTEFRALVEGAHVPSKANGLTGRKSQYKIYMSPHQLDILSDATRFVLPPAIARAATQHAPWAGVIGWKMAYQVHIGLACHNSYETETAAKGYAETKISVKKLLAITGARKKADNWKEREQIITPLERNLDALKEVGSWWYLRKDGTKAGKGELVYSEFKEACVVFRFHGEAYDIETEKALAKKQVKKTKKGE